MGFWVRKIGRDFIAGNLVRGDRESINRVDIDRAHEQVPTAAIFMHVHPFRVGERPNITSVGISDNDRGLALGLRSMVVSVGRPEPYNGRGQDIDWVDFYWDRPRW